MERRGEVARVECRGGNKVRMSNCPRCMPIIELVGDLHVHLIRVCNGCKRLCVALLQMWTVMWLFNEVTRSLSVYNTRQMEKKRACEGVRTAVNKPRKGDCVL